MTWRHAQPGPGIRRCVSCGSHFVGEGWKKLCVVCWRWRLIGWHIACAQRALRSVS